MNEEVIDPLGDKAAHLLEHQCKTVSKDLLHLPGPDFVDRIWSPSDRNNRVLGSIQRLYSTCRLSGTGYLSILPVDQGIEHSGGASGKNDFGDAAVTAVINKRAGGMGLISGRKAFQRPMAEGTKLLNIIQDVCLNQAITVA